MEQNNRLEYKGHRQPQPGKRDHNGQPLYPYIPDPVLVEAVNLAILLKRPLLLKGEPGSGKTRLARAVAYELDLPYQAWHVKSTDRGRDGLYTYDTVGRLRDAQLAAATHRLNNERAVSLKDAKDYIRWGPLGKALRNKQRTVVLIDEIDKADLDFPNDLLLVLDERRFIIDETGDEIQAEAGAEPIIFITSNDEKDLPDAFLRRCLFHYIKFPSYKRLVEIIQARFSQPSQELVDRAVNRFLELREEMHKDKGAAGKRVSTSELIDWFEVLRSYPQDEVLGKLKGTLPFASVLLKSWDDHRRYLGRHLAEEESEE